ncbi:UNVERIFIED_ORG: hypothetical protein ABIC54_005803 [Burkholderia sp. 1263]|jgi:hypothetical protein
MGNAKLEVLTRQNSQLIIIDHHPQMAFGVQSINRRVLKNDVVALASVRTAQCGCAIACNLHGHAHAMALNRTLPTGLQGVLGRVWLRVRGNLR